MTGRWAYNCWRRGGGVWGGGVRISKGLISDSVRFTNFIFPGITRNGTDSSLYYQSIGVGPLIIWTLLHSLIALAILQWNPVNATTVGP